ncbi:hypothetical protein BH11PSE9_BH11PSE9_13610 [soil metagenome]
MPHTRLLCATESAMGKLMDLLLIVPAVVVVLLVACWWLWRRRGIPLVGSEDADRIDTLAGWPPQATRILTASERLAYGLLLRALPAHLILAQVPLARFLKVPKRNSYAEWLRRLGNQSVDFVVCDMASQVLAVVDVQAPAALSSERARKRLNRMARSLKAAGIPLHVWTENALPSVEAVRETVLPKPVVKEPLSNPMPLASPSPAPAQNARDSGPSPFDETNRDSTQDELIEMREPPPSTWFDDLDSGPTPLVKPKR